MGTVIAGRYRIEARIAAGGMGTVYRAQQLGLERAVAVKLLDPWQLESTNEDSSSKDDLVVLEKRFSREAAILAKLSHPNVVTVYDYGSFETRTPDGRLDRRFYMAMEFVGGETLQERLQKRKRLPHEEAISIARQIARGLREAHAYGVVHRDLKPANVMIVPTRDGDELVKLLDFGIGKIVDASLTPTNDPRAELTGEGRFVGSPLYMAPEQIAHREVDARTDIYALGVLMYRCLAGVHPFQRENTALVMLAHLQEAPMPLRERAPDVPPWLDDIVGRALEKDPSRRPASMDEVLRSIAEHTRDGTASSSQRGARLFTPRVVANDDSPTVESAPSGDRRLTPHTATAAILPRHASDAALDRSPAAPHVEAAPPSGTLPSAMLPTTKRRPWLPIVAALLLLPLATLIVARSMRSESKPPPTAGPAPSTASVAAEAASPSATTNDHFTLTLESIPTGAEVYEDGKALGVTPLQISIANESTQKGPRTFLLRASGYRPYTLVQGASKEAVRVVAALQREPAPTASTPPPTHPHPPNVVVKPPPSAKPAPTPPPMDIQLKR